MPVLMSGTPSQIDLAMPAPGRQSTRSVLDALGIGLSALCMVHCILMPFVLVMLPQITALAGLDGAFHMVLGVVLPLIAGVALFVGYRRHGKPHTLFIGALGLACIWMAMLIPGCAVCAATLEATGEAHITGPKIIGLPLHNVVNSVGSVLLITAHVINWRACRGGSCAGACHDEG